MNLGQKKAGVFCSGVVAASPCHQRRLAVETRFPGLKLQLWPARPEKIFQPEQFQRERDVTAVTQQRHGEDVQELRARRVINPLRPGPEIPHLPEKSADQRAERQRNHRPPVAVLQPGQKMRPAQPAVHRLEDERQ